MSTLLTYDTREKIHARLIVGYYVRVFQIGTLQTGTILVCDLIRDSNWLLRETW